MLLWLRDTWDLSRVLIQKASLDRTLLELVAFVSALTLAGLFILTRITALRYMGNVFLQCVHFSVVDHIELKDIRFRGRRCLRLLRLFIWVPSYLINRRRDRIRHSVFLYHFEYLVAVEPLISLPLRRRVVEIILHFPMLLLALLCADRLLLHHCFESLTIRLIVIQFPHGLRLNRSHCLLGELFPVGFIF